MLFLCREEFADDRGYGDRGEIVEGYCYSQDQLCEFDNCHALLSLTVHQDRKLEAELPDFFSQKCFEFFSCLF